MIFICCLGVFTLFDWSSYDKIIEEYSLIIFPVENLLVLATFLSSLHSFVLRLHKSFPITPIRVLILLSPFFIWVSIIIILHFI